MKGRNYTDCPTKDLDPFNGCKPANCEEKYFGKRSYFDNEKRLCLAVPNCTGDGVVSFVYRYYKNLIKLFPKMYDIYQNECIDTKNFFTKHDIELIQKGECDNNTWNLKRSIQVVFLIL